MTGRDKDLATLRRAIAAVWLRGQAEENNAALARVEAELFRLRREVEIAAEDHVIAERHNLKRAEAAEARCERLQQAVNDACISFVDTKWFDAYGKLYATEGAEALAGPDTPADECAEHGQQRYSGCPVCVDLVERPGGERDRLRGDTPADSRPSGWVCDREDCQGRPARVHAGVDTPADSQPEENLAAQVQEARRLLAADDRVGAIAYLLGRTETEVRDVLPPFGQPEEPT